MWKVNGKIDELYSNLKRIKMFPTTCPVCKKNNAHIYMHVYDDKRWKGGLWIWCSKCYTYSYTYTSSHGSIYVPRYWENCPLVEVEKLWAIPTYLDEMREINAKA